jgi:hypothetical protein
MPNKLIRNFHRTFATLAAAARASSAVQARRAPRAEDLRALDIDPASFRRIDL